jgi:hypothetical protein
LLVAGQTINVVTNVPIWTVFLSNFASPEYLLHDELSVTRSSETFRVIGLGGSGDESLHQTNVQEPVGFVVAFKEGPAHELTNKAAMNNPETRRQIKVPMKIFPS